MASNQIFRPTFRPRARMLLLLGDQLIRDAGLAVFELVKNAYDADAPECTVTMFDISDSKKARIIVRDNGTGMDIETITSVWLEDAPFLRQLEPLTLPGKQGLWHLVLNARALYSIPNAQRKIRSAPVTRLREGIQNDLRAWFAAHAARPGYLSVR